MKRTFFLFSICVFCGAIAYAQNNIKINGEVISDRKIQKVYLNYRTEEESITDSSSVKNGRFLFSVKVAEPTFAMLRLRYAPKSEKGRGGYEARQFFLEPGINSLIVIKDSLKNAEITGGEVLKDFFQLQKMQKPFDKKRIALNDTYREYWKNKDTTGMQKISRKLASLDSTVNEDVYHRFLNNKPSSPIGLYVLEHYAGYDIDPNEIYPIFARLSKQLKNSRSGKAFNERIELAKKTAVGAMAMDFTQNDTLDKPVSLSDFKGKYVLVDFWASWCGPCRAENPNVVKAYDKYKDKNFTVLGVSLDQPGKKQSWLDAIHKDGLWWTQVSDLKFWDNAVAKQYGIQAIPQNLLIDPTGKIIAKNIRGEELNKKLEEIFK